MVSPAYSTDLASLKQRANCRAVAQQLLPNGVQKTGYDLYPSPFRDDGRNNDFAVYENGYFDYAGDQYGDVFDLVQHCLNLSFQEAVAYVARFSGTTAQSISHNHTKPTVATNEPPSTHWQEATTSILLETQAYLWSDKPDAIAARTYLRTQTLTDETIQAFGLGFNSKFRSFKGGNLPVGIVIPVWVNDVLWRVSVRTNGNPKYKNAGGSKLGGLFNADVIKTGKPVIMVEGEKDAMVVQQALGDLAAVVTLGGVSSTLSIRWKEPLKSASKVYLSYDNDEPGHNATVALVAVLRTWGIEAQVIKIPNGKDATEYATSYHGNLRTWFESQTREIWWPQGMPDTIRSGFLNYFPPSYSLTVDMLNDATRQGLINPACTSIDEIDRANHQTGYDIARNTLINQLTTDEAELIREVETELDALEVSNSQINTRQGSKRGRKAKRYALISGSELKQRLIDWAMPRIDENLQPAHTADPVLARISASMLQDALSTSDDCNDLAQEVNFNLSPAIQKQPRHKRRASKQAVDRKAEFIASLDDLTSTPLPDGWAKSNAHEYRIAFARAILEARGEIRETRQSLCTLFGVSNGSLGPLLKAAWWETHEQFVTLELSDTGDLGQQVREGGFNVKGFAKYIVTGHDDQLRECPYTPHLMDAISSHLQSGEKVSIRYQTANRYTLGDTVLIPKKPKPKYASTKAPLLSEDFVAKDKLRPFYGPRYNPEWIRTQLRLALVATGWRRHGTNLINPDGGEMLRKEDSLRLLLEAIIKRPITSPA